MKKKLLIALLVVCLVLSMLPMAFAASKTYEVKTVAELNIALDEAVDGDTIKFGANFTLDEPLVIDKAITINGNNKTLTSSGNRAINVDVAGKVAIKSLTIKGQTGCERGINIINKAAEVTISSVAISGVSHYAVHIATSAGEGTKVDISNCELTGYAALAIYGDGRTVTVKNSTLVGKNSYGNPESNSFCTIALEGSDNELTVTGGSVTANQTGEAVQTIIGGCVGTVGDNVKIVLNTQMILRSKAEWYFGYEEELFGTEGFSLVVRDDYAEALGEQGIATAKTSTSGLVSIAGEGVVKDSKGALYASLGDAFAAGGEIVLYQDLELTEAAIVPAGKTVTLDLAGYTISPASNWDCVHNALIIVGRKGNLTVKDSSKDKTGLIDGTGNSEVYAALQVTYYGETGTGDATLTINSGTVQGTYYGITGNGNRDGSKITVNGGKIEGLSTGGTGIFHPHKGTVTVNGGEIVGASGIEMRAGTLVINGGTITANGNFSESANGSGNTVTGAAVAISQHTTEKAISLTVNGGKLIGDYAVYEKDLQEDPSKSITLKLVKGEFQGDVASENCTGFITGGIYDYEPAAELLGKGLSVVQNIEGKWTIGDLNVAKVGSTKYATLQEAVDAALKKKSATVTLLRDVIITEPVVLDGVYLNAKAEEKGELTYGAITLDLAGFALAADGVDFDSDAVVIVGRKCTLTVKDSSKDQTGIITYNGNPDVYTAIKMTFNGDAGVAAATLNVESGTIQGYYYGIAGNGSRERTIINVNGGVIEGVNGTGIFHPQKGTLNINAGEIKGLTGIEMRAGTLTIKDGQITATGAFSASANGSGTTMDGVAVALSQHTTEKSIKLTVTGGTLTGYYAVYEKDLQDDPSEDISISLLDGLFGGMIYSENCEEFVVGGLYASNMSRYCERGKTAVGNTATDTGAKYPYKVGVAGANPAATTTLPFDSFVGAVVETDDAKLKEVYDALIEAQAAIRAMGNGIDAALATRANNNTVTVQQGAEALAEKFGGTVDPAAVTILVQGYLKVTVVSVNADGSVTLDLTPMYRTLATTAMGFADLSEDNTVDMGKGGKLTVTGETVVYLPVTGIEDGLCIVQHIDGSKKHLYAGEVDGGFLFFVNPNGFSKFILGVEPPAAMIGEVGYATLKDAINAVPDGGTIVLTADNDEYVSVRRTIKFYLTVPENSDIEFTGSIVAGAECKDLSTDEYYQFDYNPSDEDHTTTEDGNADDDEDDSSGGSGNGPFGDDDDEDSSGGSGFAWINPYTDVDEDDWFYDAVEYVTCMEMMNGTEDGTTFSPELKMTRAMLMTMLARLDGVDTTIGNTWWEAGVEWAVDNGIADEGDPHANITREEIALMLWRYAGSPTVKANWLLNHPDGTSVSANAKAAMNWAVYVGLFEGDENANLMPQGEASRMEVATLIMRYCQKILDM